FLAVFGGSVLSAQMQDNRDKQMTCNNGRSENRARHCDIRELTLTGVGSLTIDGGRNGGAIVKGWLRNDVLVRAKIDVWAETDAAAASLAGQIRVQTAAGQVNASGPESPDHSGWAVSYEVFVPQNTNLNLKTHNGGISVSDVRGRLEFDATNGGVRLTRVAGDVGGATVNGGLHVKLAGDRWDGRQLAVSTTNGGVTIEIPERYSAHIQTGTVNGGFHSDFPITVRGDLKPHAVDFDLGSGGPLIHVSTTNGGVTLKRL
ncbi:MAG: DUF4097 family beta strand repeat-containing protein, partial [Bryobacteraceae bacterium]